MNAYLVPAIGILGTLVVTLVGILIRRLYKSIDLLFSKVDNLQRQVNALKLVAIKGDPDSSILFQALTRNGEHK